MISNRFIKYVPKVGSREWPLREGQIGVFAVISAVTQTFTDISGYLFLIFIIYTSMDRY